MKSTEQIILFNLNNLPTLDLELYLELGEKEQQKGNKTQSIFWYSRGYEMAKRIKDRGRIQQFSNILCSQL